MKHLLWWLILPMILGSGHGTAISETQRGPDSLQVDLKGCKVYIFNNEDRWRFLLRTADIDTLLPLEQDWFKGPSSGIPYFGFSESDDYFTISRLSYIYVFSKKDGSQILEGLWTRVHHMESDLLLYRTLDKDRLILVNLRTMKRMDVTADYLNARLEEEMRDSEFMPDYTDDMLREIYMDRNIHRMLDTKEIADDHMVITYRDVMNNGQPIDLRIDISGLKLP